MKQLLLKILGFRQDKVPPLKGFPRRDKERAMLEQGAKMGVCVWCGQSVPLYDNGGSEVRDNGAACYLNTMNGTCIACGRNPYQYFGDWIYRAEYKDGCCLLIFEEMYKQKHDIMWSGDTHAPHYNFVKDKPIRRWRRNSIPVFIQGR